MSADPAPTTSDRTPPHTPGPWRWYANAKQRTVYLATAHSGRRFVMQFDRCGMHGAQPTGQLRDGPDGVMVPLFEAPERYGTAPDHNGDFEVTHPDFVLIASAPDLAAENAWLRARAALLESALRGLGGWAMSCELVNSPGWLEGLGEWIDRADAALSTPTE